MKQKQTNKNSNKEIYQFEVMDAQQNTVSMTDYKDKMLLIVNTATGCRYTPQYKGMEELYRKYKSKGFEILDFPCNQFGYQAPESNTDIVKFCKLNFGITFKIFSKIKVNGFGASPLFSYLKKEQGGLIFGKIKWNFTKFLVDREGNVVKRYEPNVEPAAIEADLLSYL